MKRRAFLTSLGATYAISMLDWMRFFGLNGIPGTAKTLGIAEAVAAASDPHFLIYWFCEGGWDGYSMFNPVATRNDALGTSAPLADRIYRPANVPLVNGLYPVATQGNIRYGHLAAPGTTLFNDMAVVSSHRGGTFHSGSRLDYHMGLYPGMDYKAARAADERSVMQAFTESFGAGHLLPHVSWHNWLADGELSPTTYPEGTGYYEKLGPAHAHTIYGGTPESMRQRISQISASIGSARDAKIHSFVENLHANFLKDKNGESVKAFAAAVAAHKALVTGGGSLDATNLFKDPTLNASFGVQPADLLTSNTDQYGRPTRSKNSPSTNVQALMTYELMTKGASIGFWIESQRVREFDTHLSRGNAEGGRGTTNQLARMEKNLWTPLKALVAKLKATPYAATGKSYWDFTTCVLASEMGRTFSGGNGLDDVCQHWNTSSVAFLGGTVKGGTQFGSVGTQSFDAIPLLPSGALDPAYDPTTGVLKPGQSPSAASFVPDAGHVYATALELAGIPKSSQTGKNTRPPMSFLKK